jgi:RNA repair pathway DNA polymerase beta family
LQHLWARLSVVPGILALLRRLGQRLLRHARPHTRTSPFRRLEPDNVTGVDLIVEMRFGSHLYGTDTPESDVDVKGVYLPEARDILLQRVPPSVTASRDKGAGERNRPGDVDREYYSLQRYLGLLAAGQTVAIDMLFAPETAMTRPPSPLWREIQDNAHRFVSRRASAFVRYCRQQANKYGIKGSRVAAARSALALITAAEEKHGTVARLGTLDSALLRFVAETQHVALVDAELRGGAVVRQFEVCGRKIPLTASIKTAREVVQRLVAAYGQRTRQAEKNEGVDWKALSHAVRVGREAVELFGTGRIVFPLPYADHLTRIKRGALRYAVVADEIEQLLDAVAAAAARSSLPEVPDEAAMNELVLRAYRAKVRAIES